MSNASRSFTVLSDLSRPQTETKVIEEKRSGFKRLSIDCSDTLALVNDPEQVPRNEGESEYEARLKGGPKVA